MSTGRALFGRALTRVTTSFALVSSISDFLPRRLGRHGTISLLNRLLNEGGMNLRALRGNHARQLAPRIENVARRDGNERRTIFFPEEGLRI